MDSNLGCQTQVSSCLHYWSKLRANLSLRLCAPNNVQKQSQKYLLFGAYWSNAEVKATEETNKAEEAVQ